MSDPLFVETYQGCGDNLTECSNLCTGSHPNDVNQCWRAHEQAIILCNDAYRTASANVKTDSDQDEDELAQLTRQREQRKKKYECIGRANAALSQCTNSTVAAAFLPACQGCLDVCMEETHTCLGSPPESDDPQMGDPFQASLSCLAQSRDCRALCLSAYRADWSATAAAALPAATQPQAATGLPLNQAAAQTPPPSQLAAASSPPAGSVPDPQGPQQRDPQLVGAAAGSLDGVSDGSAPSAAPAAPRAVPARAGAGAGADEPTVIVPGRSGASAATQFLSAAVPGATSGSLPSGATSSSLGAAVLMPCEVAPRGIRRRWSPTTAHGNELSACTGAFGDNCLGRCQGNQICIEMCSAALRDCIGQCNNRLMQCWAATAPATAPIGAAPSTKRRGPPAELMDAADLAEYGVAAADAGSATQATQEAPGATQDPAAAECLVWWIAAFAAFPGSHPCASGRVDVVWWVAG
ncbi:hypothetical protein PAPYR_3518 [Paratrimastix pyriformis]|uniref:Uncharacterized protein n=1 Tax=Paratrimastix pyriformis TaxID=342808 RepID=A0ABQ8UUR4_9EUKA|nr:hypothetical protein PAPYR_3518 [Paratrimastix pyriformis]